MSDLFSQPFEDERRRPATPDRRVYSVSELTASIRGLLESSFGDVWVEGEVSNCRLWNTGHLYLTLKDGGAQIKAVMFRSAVRYLEFKVEDGQHVIARGRLGVYDPKGEYQLVCEHLQPRGLGALQVAFEQLKKKLQAEGLFAAERKRPLPALPARIGIVTSLEGAALRDIIKVLRRRHASAHLVIRPARVQGEGAAAEIADALRSIGRVKGVDVVIVGRGGGSAEDLWSFNEEPVARAIASCPVPVVSAVGHEVDFTIADFVADVRAPTPSAAAEMVIAAKDEFCARIDRLRERLRASMLHGLQARRSDLHLLERRRGLGAFEARLAMRGRHVAELSHQLRSVMQSALGRRERQHRALQTRLESHDIRRRLAAVRARLEAAATRLVAAARRRQDGARAQLATLSARIDSLSPLAVLGRGYAVCWNADRTRIIRDASAVAPGDDVRVRVQVGELFCRVKESAGDGHQ
ncbi:MAG TPA: exodeoxyribonuclease VII large subunit [Vicinamibacterales bacterium]|nr:exodeoxyribonuclease VII large subunit [Vicinamibacterales bacterium]